MARNNVPDEHREYQEWRDLLRRVRALEQRQPNVPILDTDPPADSPLNFWLMTDGRLRYRLENGTIKEVGSADPTGGAAPPVVVEATTQTYRKTYHATWSRSFQGDGSVRSTSSMYFGYYPSGYNGRQKSMFGLPYSDIQTDLAGASIKKVEIFLDMIHSYSHAGVTVYFGGHSNAGAPGSWSNVDYTRRDSGRWPKVGSEWRTVSNSIGADLRSGAIRGIVLDPRSDSIGLYGYAAGFSGQGSKPAVRITYVK